VRPTIDGASRSTCLTPRTALNTGMWHEPLVLPGARRCRAGFSADPVFLRSQEMIWAALAGPLLAAAIR
jgi:hypothetical protein